MSKGMHYTVKTGKDSTFHPYWSGRSYAPHSELKCEVCLTQLHKEGHDSLYCPRCDDFRQGAK